MALSSPWSPDSPPPVSPSLSPPSSPVASSLPSSPPALPAPWLVLGRVTLVWYGAEGAPEHRDPFFITIDEPPCVSTLALPLSVHPAPHRHGADTHPYVLAADDAGILLHVSRAPSVGFDLAARYPPGALVMLRDFLPADAGRARETPTATVVRVPDRRRPLQPGIASVKHVGLVSLPGTDDYVIAELRLVGDHDRATLLSFRSGTAAWVEREAICPAMAGLEWRVPPDDVISHNGKLWWVNLALGLFGWDPLAGHQLAVLRHKHLPEVFAVEDLPPQPEHPELHRMVRVSNRKVRFVGMTRTRDDPLEETLVVVWTLEFGEFDAASWKQRRVTSLAEIWASESYRETGMPQEAPALALLHPTNPDVVFFFLGQYLFSVDVSSSEVVDFLNGEPYDLQVDVAGLVRRPPISWRYVLAWMLPPSLHNALDDDEGEDPSSEELDGQDTD
ncbi:hypothetical protein ACP4OV_006456 [Aristida adscensionis]